MKFECRLSSTIVGGDHWHPGLVEGLVSWKHARSEVKDFRTDSIIFEQDDVEVPEQWTQTAIDILAQKYFRKAGVPEHKHHVEEEGVPLFLCRAEPIAGTKLGRETSARQVFRRLVGCWTYWAWKSNYFNDLDQARIFYDEMFLILAWQYAAPNSPQWFNTGLHWAYGIEGGNDNGQFYVPTLGQRGAMPWATIADTERTTNGYERPQPHACFLTGTEDNLVGHNGIMQTWATEARIFKYGSGSGVNISRWRGPDESLSGGGVASGAMSWLSIGDKAAGSIQSGGTTRRAAKMILMDDDHPELREFIHWKEREEHKAASMYVGSKLIEMYSRGELAEELHSLIPPQTRARLANGFPAEVFGIGYEEEANRTIDGQNSNNSIRVTDLFMETAERKGDWRFKFRTQDEYTKWIAADLLWNDICRATWACADPGIIFCDTVNAWNTCAADGEIRTCNPCAEFHHLDWSACNLASSRLTAFLRLDGTFDVPMFIHVNRYVTVVLDISVTMAAFPTPEFAVGAFNYRTLGIGYTDLGGLLMRLGIPYDSDEARQLAACITSLMTAVSYLTSADLAKKLGPFPRWEANKEDFMRVMHNHNVAHHYPLYDNFKSLNVKPHCVARQISERWQELYKAGSEIWSLVVEQESFRNAQASLIAPTGTITFAMDSTTTGIEPEFALVKKKNLAGGGTMVIVNRSIEPALRSLGYDEERVSLVLRNLEEGRTLEQALPEATAEQLKVFETANQIRWEAHVLMMAAIQPFLSGAASKTINLPEEATVEDVSGAFKMCHQLGIKAVALYRNNSKLSQPQEDASASSTEFKPSIVNLARMKEYSNELGIFAPLSRGAREYLPWRRESGYTQKAKIGHQEQTVFWRTGNYPDGRLGEIFIELAKQGSMMRASANLVAIAVSIGLQHGVPLDKYANEFIGVKFEPEGYVEGHDEISFASSYIDMIFRDLAITYLGRDDLRKNADHAVLGDPTKIVALDRTAVAVAQGGVPTGHGCPGCGGELIQDGKCLYCTNCRWNQGCSG